VRRNECGDDAPGEVLDATQSSYRPAWRVAVMRLAARVAVMALVLSMTMIGGTLGSILAGGWASGEATVAGPTLLPDPTPTLLPDPSPTMLPSPSPTPPLAPRTFSDLSADLTTIAHASGARASVSLIELGGNRPEAWSLKGDLSWSAASVYKLPLLMAEAKGIAEGRLHGSDRLCYQASDAESGYYDDYYPGECFKRDVLAQRAGLWSDNTAAHILVRYLGGASALNAFAKSMGAIESQFYDFNTTTSSDLARLWASEASGKAGGESAQRWLYPLLTKTAYEAGIPAGTPSAPVIHKIGSLNTNLHDAALVANGPRGAYVLVICSDGGAAGGWPLLARLAQRVWQFESARSIE
jgi:beta-lactamase class A